MDVFIIIIITAEIFKKIKPIFTENDIIGTATEITRVIIRENNTIVQQITPMEVPWYIRASICLVFYYSKKAIQYYNEVSIDIDHLD